MDTGVIEGGLNVTLTIRLLMHGKVRVFPPPRPPKSSRAALSGSAAPSSPHRLVAAISQWCEECAPWHPAGARAARDDRGSALKAQHINKNNSRGGGWGRMSATVGAASAWLRGLPGVCFAPKSCVLCSVAGSCADAVGAGGVL